MTAKHSNIIPAYLIAYSDSGFTNPHEVVLNDSPKNLSAEYTHIGVKYTGLETSRHPNTTVNTQKQCLQYDHNQGNWAHVGLKERALIDQIEISTRFFTGNQVRALSVTLEDAITGIKQLVLKKVSLAPDKIHQFSIPPTLATECHLQLYHEGGLTRIQFFGKKTKEQIPPTENLLEKASILAVSNDHYGHPKMAVAGNRKEQYMVGWESARTGFGEQVLFQLNKPTIIEKIIVDTYLHRLNAPLSCHIFGLNTGDNLNLDDLLAQQPYWTIQFENGKKVIPKDFQQYMLTQKFLQEAVPNPNVFNIQLELAVDSAWKAILPFEPLQADRYHRFGAFQHNGPFTHLLYLHYPNGGIHGLKVFGQEKNL